MSDPEIPMFWEIFCTTQPLSCVDPMSKWIRRHKQLSIFEKQFFFLIKRNDVPIACVELRNRRLLRFSVLPMYLELGYEIVGLIITKARELGSVYLQVEYDEKYHPFFQKYDFKIRYQRIIKQKSLTKIQPTSNIEHAAFVLEKVQQNNVKELSEFFYVVYYGGVDYDYGIAARTIKEWKDEIQKNLAGRYGIFLTASSLILRDRIKKNIIGTIFITKWLPKTAKITTIGVSKEYQRQGIGTFLIQKSMEILARKGYRYIQLDVTVDNEPAVNLYSKMKFEKISGEYRAEKFL
ncbi:MAG: GNAT family N-acetyltransferase [Promethearchaeota archaeon]